MFDRRKTAVLIIVFAALLFVYLAAGSRPVYKWEDGARQMYRFSIRNAMQSSAALPFTQGNYERISMSGVLNFRICGRTPENVKAAFQMSPLKISSGRIRNSALEKVLGMIFYADINPAGEFTGFEFSPDVSPEDGLIIEDIMRSFQFVLARPFLDKWKTRERDRNGIYSSLYRLSGGGIAKSKKEYLEYRENTSAGMKIKKSAFSAVLTESTSWIYSCEGSELLAVHHEDGPAAVFSTKTKMVSIKFAPLPGLDIWDPDVEADEMISAWRKMPRNMISVMQKSVSEGNKQRFENKSFEEMADGLFLKYVAFDIACLHDLIDFFKLKPESPELVPGYIRKNRLTAAQNVMLVHALERYGSSASEKALCEIMSAGGFTPESRIQAAIGLGSFVSPSRESVEGLWKSYRSGSGQGGVEEDVSGASILSLGALARNMDDNPGDTEEAGSSEIKTGIEDELSSVRGLNALTSVIRAAGNTGDDSFCDEMMNIYTDDRPSVRSAVVSSMVFLGDEKVNRELSGVLPLEKNANVREAIVNTLRKKEADDNSVAAVIENAFTEDNELVRASMYRFILKNREHPEVKKALPVLLENEKSPELGKILHRAASTRTAGRKFD